MNKRKKYMYVYLTNQISVLESLSKNSCSLRRARDRSEVNGVGMRVREKVQTVLLRYVTTLSHSHRTERG